MPNSIASAPVRPSATEAWIANTFGLLFKAVAWLIFTALAIVEPVVTFVVSVIVLLGLGMAVFYGLVLRTPDFHFGAVFVVVGAAVLALGLFGALLALLRPR